MTDENVTPSEGEVVSNAKEPKDILSQLMKEVSKGKKIVTVSADPAHPADPAQPPDVSDKDKLGNTVHPAVYQRRQMERGVAAPAPEGFGGMLAALGIRPRSASLGQEPSNIHVHAFQVQQNDLLIQFGAQGFQGQLSISLLDDQDLNWAIESFRTIVQEAVARRLQP